MEKVNTWLLNSAFVGRLGTHVKQIIIQQHWFCPEFIFAIKLEKDMLIRSEFRNDFGQGCITLRERNSSTMVLSYNHQAVSRVLNAMITTAASKIKARNLYAGKKVKEREPNVAQASEKLCFLK